MYYHNLITQKSWEELVKLNKIISFVLIGGWATYLYTRDLKSKDIDILVDYESLGKLKEKYEVVKNDRLKKYEARKGEIQIDIYLPYYSEIGIPIDVLIDNKISFEGFNVLKKEWQIVLKIYVFSHRARTAKGEKDFLDLLSLFKSGADFKTILEIIKKFKLDGGLKFFLTLLSERTEAMDINLNKHQYKKLKTETQTLIL